MAIVCRVADANMASAAGSVLALELPGITVCMIRPVAIVPAPYGRNLERLARALSSAHARQRVDGEAETSAIRLNADKLARGRRWTLRCGVHDLDVEGRAPGLPRYQELLYEAGTFELEPGLKIDVASPEDVERYDHVQKTGVAPEIKITRKRRQPTQT